MKALRFSEDLWALTYLAATSALLLVQWNLAQPYLPLIALSCLMAYGVGCILHNHAHLSMWRHKTLNTLTDYWIILLRGDGVYSWLPTHVLNHHRFANKPGDMTLTYRLTERNNLFNLIGYTAQGLAYYLVATLRYIASFRSQMPRRFIYLISQIALHVCFVGGALFLDMRKTLLFILIPQAFGLIAMVATGYFQHHHTDETSEFNFARNFTGKLNNLMHFNHGFHTVHHLDMGLHWSEWPAAHRALEPQMEPCLNQPNLPWYMVRTLILAPLNPLVASRDLRRERLTINDEPG
jgi:fatty acid desaturase